MKPGDYHETRIHVRYKDTDMMGVVYYGNFFTFYEEARTVHMKALGASYSEMEKNGVSLAVTEASAKYVGNVSYDDVIIIRSRARKLSPARVRFDYECVDETGRLLVTGHTVHAPVSHEDGKVIRLPEKLSRALGEEL